MEDDLATITVLVHFVAPLSLPGVSEGDLIAALKTDLDAEFASQGISFTVQQSEINFVVATETAVAQLEAQTGLKQARERVAQLLKELPGDYEDPENLPEELKSALEAYESSGSAFETLLANSSNLAGLERGTIGFVVTPAEAYGGVTDIREKWSKLSTGLAPVIFPEPAVLQAGSLEGPIDFSSAAFDPFRATYDDTARARFILRDIVNTAKHQLGHQFGLADKPLAPLTDAMREPINLQSAEHFIRARDAVHFGPTDVQIVASRLRAWSE